MQILINNSSMQPIYEQIEEQIKVKILDQSLMEGSILPSVRTLSKELRVSALTVKKAYDTLEREGIIITVHGKGSYVAHAGSELRLEEQKKAVESALEEAIRKGRCCGMKDEEIQELFEIIMEEDSCY